MPAVLGEATVGIAADQHETRLAQGKQAGEAVEQVHGHAHQAVDGALAQHRDQHQGEGVGGQDIVQQDGHKQDRAQNENGRQNAAFFLSGS